MGVKICDGWLSERFAFGPVGEIVVAGTSYCTSPAEAWPPQFKCRDSIDPDGDAAPLFFHGASGSSELIAGGIISPQVTGWVHVSTKNRTGWAPRVNIPFPVRDTIA